METNVRFDGPGKYMVNTRERIDDSFLEIFNIHLITPSGQKEDPFYNQLIIKVRDQAELSGFLSALYNCRYTLLGINYLTD